MTLTLTRWPVAVCALGLMLAACGGDAGGGGGDGAGSASSPGAGVEAVPEEGTEPAGDSRVVEAEEVWRWPAEPPGSVGMPSVDADGAAFTYGHLRVVLLDLDGELQWEVERRRLRDVAPALTPDLVVAATEDGVMAVDRGTGRVRWDTEIGERANGPVVVGGRAVVSTWEGSLTAFDLADGRVAWRAALPGPAIGPATTDGEVVAATWESRFGDAAGAVVVEAADGRERWSVPLEPGGVGGPAIIPLPTSPPVSVVVVVAGDIAAHGFDLADGHERWRAETEGRGSPEVPPLPLDDGEVLLAHRLAGLMLVDADSGVDRWVGSADGAAVRGGPVGPGPDGPFAFPLDDGRLFLVGPDVEAKVLDWPGRVSGVAMAPDGLLLVGTREARANHLIALRVSAA